MRSAPVEVWPRLGGVEAALVCQLVVQRGEAQVVLVAAGCGAGAGGGTASVLGRWRHSQSVGGCDAFSVRMPDGTVGNSQSISAQPAAGQGRRRSRLECR